MPNLEEEKDGTAVRALIPCFHFSLEGVGFAFICCYLSFFVFKFSQYLCVFVGHAALYTSRGLNPPEGTLGLQAMTNALTHPKACDA